MWIFKYPSKAFIIWLSHWVCLLEDLVAILTLCLYQPAWGMKWLCWYQKRDMKRRKERTVSI